MPKPWLLLLLLPFLMPAPAFAFPVKFPGRKPDGTFAEPEPIRKEFPIGDVTVIPRDLQVGDTVVFPFILPSKSNANTDFISYNKEMPGWLEASNETALPAPITGGEDIESAIIYTVISAPGNGEQFTFQAWGLSETQVSQGPGATLVVPIKCVPEIF